MPGTNPCRVVVLDTGLAVEGFRPDLGPWGPGCLEVDDTDGPDEDGDEGVDPVAGHGTFIAGLITRLAPGSDVSVSRVLSTFGIGDDLTIAKVIAGLDPVPDILNCSFGAFTADDEEPLAMTAEIAAIQAKGCVVVASAGNDATCRPKWPAALPEVVSVAALGPAGPAWFTNFGPWVRAAAPGVDVVSRFFSGPAPVDAYGDGWASWSGTSFAAPIVAGVLARAVCRDGLTTGEAVARHVDDPGLLRIAGLGTIVNER